MDQKKVIRALLEVIKTQQDTIDSLLMVINPGSDIESIDRLSSKSDPNRSGHGF